VTALTITDNNKKSITFVKQGDTWTVAGTDGYPAQSDKIAQTLGKLLSIKTDRLVTQTPGSQDRLQVAESNFMRRVDITSTAASGVQTIFLGSSTGAAATHVRSAAEDATYLTGALATWELDTIPTSWMDVSYYTVPKEQLKGVTLKNANGTFDLIPKPGSADWTLADATADEPVAAANISTLLDRITTVNFASVLGKTDAPAYGLGTPLATLIITSTEPLSSTASTTGTTATSATVPSTVKTTTLTIGAKDEANSAYYLKSSDSDYYVLLAAFTGDDFVNKTRADFMEKASADASGDTTGGGSVAPLAPAVGQEGPLPEATASAIEEQATPPAVEEGATPAATQLENSEPPIATAGAAETQGITTTSVVTATAQPTAQATVAAGEVVTETSKVEATLTPTTTATAKPAN